VLDISHVDRVPFGNPLGMSPALEPLRKLAPLFLR